MRKKSAEQSRPSWEPMPGEGSKAHAAAFKYFLMGPERSIKKVSQQVTSRISTLEGWSANWEWVRRASEYDAYRAAQERAAMERQARETNAKWQKRREEHLERQFDLAEKLEEKARKMLEFPLARVTHNNSKTNDSTTIINPARWSMSHIVAMITVARQMKAEALEQAAPVEEVEIEETWIDEPFTEEDAAKI